MNSVKKQEAQRDEEFYRQNLYPCDGGAVGDLRVAGDCSGPEHSRRVGIIARRRSCPVGVALCDLGSLYAREYARRRRARGV